MPIIILTSRDLRGVAPHTYTVSLCLINRKKGKKKGGGRPSMAQGGHSRNSAHDLTIGFVVIEIDGSTGSPVGLDRG